MTETAKDPRMPAEVAAIVEHGFATWANDSNVDEALRARFDAEPI